MTVRNKHRQRGGVRFDGRLDALAELVRNITLECSDAEPALVQAFLAAG